MMQIPHFKCALRLLCVLGLYLFMVPAVHAQNSEDQASESPQTEEKQENLGPTELMFEYYDTAFKPFHKGRWFTGLTFNVQDEKLRSDNEFIGFDQVIEGKEFNYEIRLKGGYAIGNYTMVGLGIAHGRDKSEGLGIILNDTINRESVTNKNTISPFMRNYYPLSKNHRISFFNEIKMDFGFGNTDSYRLENGQITEQETSDTFLFGIGLSPGINFFAIENFAFEIQLDVLGYQYERTETVEDTGEVTVSDSHNVNFTLNLLSLNFGLAYYFGAKKQGP